jgi:molybdopterin/thiamine biosynthesis adenylyltransferase
MNQPGGLVRVILYRYISSGFTCVSDNEKNLWRRSLVELGVSGVTCGELGVRRDQACDALLIRINGGAW